MPVHVCCGRVLGLHMGEVFGLTWELVDLDAAKLYVGEQVQRVGRELIRRQVKTETSEAPLPLPEPCVAALKLRQAQQETDRDRAQGAWIDTGLVFTTRTVPRWNRETSAVASIAASSKPRCPGSRCTAPARPADPCLPP